MATFEDIITIYEEGGEIHNTILYEDDEDNINNINNRFLNKNILQCEWTGHTPTIKNKSYIKLGDECSICNEKIFFHSHSFLGDCGHAFHKKCINKWYIRKENCPICRKELSIWIEFYERYNHRHNNFNLLDKLENFWYNLELQQLPWTICKTCKNKGYPSYHCNNCIS